jgi:hypothetical protein
MRTGPMWTEDAWLLKQSRLACGADGLRQARPMR